MHKLNPQQEFLSLYEPLHNQLYRYCRTLAGNVNYAEDLMNDTLLAAFEQFNKLRNPDSFKYYLFRIAGNLHKMQARRAKFTAEFCDTEHDFLKDSGADAEIIADYHIILNKIQALPAKTSEALLLFYSSDFSLNDIQKIQGGTLSAVKLRIKRGKEKLLESLNTTKQIRLAHLLLSF